MGPEIGGHGGGSRGGERPRDRGGGGPAGVYRVRGAEPVGVFGRAGAGRGGAGGGHRGRGGAAGGGEDVEYRV